MASKKSGGPTIGLRNNKLIFIGIGVLIILVFIGVFSLLRTIYQTETYYVLTQDVQAQSRVTADMLSPIVTSKDTAPPNAIDPADERFQAGAVYTRYPLSAGDILSASNAGGREDISVGIPDDWVVTSFSVSADNAVGGRIHRGYYFDMLIATGDQAFYPFVNMLALDTTVSLNSASSNRAADTEEAHSGQTSQYVVGLPPQDAARLHQIVNKYGGDIKLILSPRQNEYAAPQLASYTGTFTYEGDTKNMGVGTDRTFTPLERDDFGRPVEVVPNCSDGNAKLTDAQCEALAEAEPTESTTTTPPSDSDPSSNPEDVDPSQGNEESEEGSTSDEDSTTDSAEETSAP